MMLVLVTGGTGFTGRRVLPLLKDHCRVRLFARSSSDTSLAQSLGFEIVQGDLGDPLALKKAMQDCDGLINIASIGFGHAPLIVNAALEAKVMRTLFVGTTAIFTRLPANSKKTRTEAEDIIFRSGLDWTLLRPTMIYGDSDDRNIYRMLRFFKWFPFVPVPGNGHALMQPIHVDDLAQAIVAAFFCQRTVGKAYNLSGRNPLSFNDLINQGLEALHLQRVKIHLPLGLVRFLIRFYAGLVKHPRIKEEQLLRLCEDKSFSHQEAVDDFNFQPRSFREGVACEVRTTNLLTPGT